jgi:hypothetical protein
MPGRCDGRPRGRARLIPGGAGPLVAQIAHGLVLGMPAAEIEDENVILAVVALALFDQEHLPTGLLVLRRVALRTPLRSPLSVITARGWRRCRLAARGRVPARPRLSGRP